MEANISKKSRRAVYERDGWRCALCDCSQGLQVHHVKPRGKGGSAELCNLVTLCSRCHAAAHGHDLDGTGITAEDVRFDILVYLSDLYAEDIQSGKVVIDID